MNTNMRELWERIKEPRAVHVAQCTIYVVTLLVGIAALLFPPRSIEGAVGEGLATLWAAFLILGGGLGMFAVLPGIWWLERVAVLAGGTGAAMYGSIVFTLHLTESGNRLPQSGMILIVLLSFVKRWVSIRRHAYDPEK